MGTSDYPPENALNDAFTTPSANEELGYEESSVRNILRRIRFTITLGIFLLLAGIIAYRHAVAPPAQFPINTPITIEFGTSVRDITKQLKAAGVVRYELPLYAVLVLKHTPSNIKASTYTFSEPLDIYDVAQTLTRGNYAYDLVRITLKEGMPVTVLATDVHQLFPNIAEASFLAEATPYEGELFPETYFVPRDISQTELIRIMRAAHQAAMDTIAESPKENSLTNDEVVILASILEREANSSESMEMVANILVRRLETNMPLQVDATMEYVLGKPLSDLLPDDLKLDSPYNTYTRTGLPPTPIGNPGMIALRAAYHATSATPYLFYVTGDDGNFYYGRDFDEHRMNIAKYLRN